MFIENNKACSTNNYTVPNQKTVIVHREMPVKDFLQIKNENWMEVNKKFTPYGLQVYLYLAKMDSIWLYRRLRPKKRLV